MSNIKSFSIYREYYDLLSLLSTKERGNVLLAMVSYMFDDIEISLTDREKKVFINLKRPLDKSKNKSSNATKQDTNQNQNESKIKTNDVTHQDVNVIVNVNDNVNINNLNNNIFTSIEDNFARTLSPLEFETIESWLSDYSEEIINYAVKISVMNNKKSFSYVNGILKNWKSAGYKTLQEIKDAETKTNNSENRPKVDIFEYDWLNDDESEKKDSDISE